MKPGFRACLFLIILVLPSARADDAWIDRLDEALTFASADATMRARVSGTLDLEAYEFPQPAPALIDAEGRGLFTPRLTTFLDVQAGPVVYGFAQARLDRGFDPEADAIRLRLDEYALRVTPWADGRLSFQAGKFAAAVGNWISRHGSWDNPFISAPLPYENQTGLWDSVAARSGATVLGWAHVHPPLPPGAYAGDKYLRIPIIWGPSYATGVSVSGAAGSFEYAAELKESALSSRPSTWDDADFRWRHPTLSGRVGYRPNFAWNFGLSASRGTYLSVAALPTLPPGVGLGDYRQTVLGQDVSFAWHHVQVWAEAFESRFEIPRVGHADTTAYYVEARYKFTAQLFGALRWNEQFFGKIPDGLGGEERWGGDIWRLDVAPTYRLTSHAQVKLQYSLEHDSLRLRPQSHLLAAQVVIRF